MAGSGAIGFLPTDQAWDHGRMARVLVSETISERGLSRLRDAGHEVDIRLGLTPAELEVAVKGAAALIIRSETQVTAEVLEAGHRPGRRGPGRDRPRQRRRRPPPPAGA